MTLLLSGDVMTGRGVDQVLPHPGDPALREPHVGDARTYVELAERANGPVPRPVDATWVWGDALGELRAAAPDVRILNLETAVTRSDDFAAGKGVHYRMAPANLDVLTITRPDVCAVANNHVLDFGVGGLEETLDVLAGAGLRTAGGGRDRDRAWSAAAVPLTGGGRCLVLAIGMSSSGIPASWAATEQRPGVAFVDEPSEEAAAAVLAHGRQQRRPDDLLVVSIHWGSNWGYEVSRAQVRFAHALVDGGVDVVHGHSSHHPRPIEIYRGKLILYGCGDLIDDYEGIRGYEHYRDDLRPLYFATLDRRTGALADLRIVPFQARRLRLGAASRADAAWLRATLERVSRPSGTRVDLGPDGALTAGAG